MLSESTPSSSQDAWEVTGCEPLSAELSDFDELDEEFDEEDFDDDFDDDFEEELDDEYEIEADDSILGPEFQTSGRDTDADDGDGDDEGADGGKSDKEDA